MAIVGAASTIRELFEGILAVRTSLYEVQVNREEFDDLKTRLVSLVYLAENLKQQLQLDSPVNPYHSLLLQKVLKVCQRVYDFLKAQASLSWFAEFLFRGVRSKTLSRLHEDIARCQEDLTAAFTLETRFIAQQIVEIYAQGGQAVLDKVAAVKLLTSEPPKLHCEIKYVGPPPVAAGPTFGDDSEAGDTAPLQRQRTSSLLKEKGVSAEDKKLFRASMKVLSRRKVALPTERLENETDEQFVVRVAAVMQEKLQPQDQYRISVELDGVLGDRIVWIPASEVMDETPHGVIGKGGFGEVRRVKYKGVNAAMKVSFSFSEQENKRLEREYLLLRDACSQYVVHVYGLCRLPSGIVGLVMELMPPPYNVRDLLQGNKDMSMRDRIALMLDIARAFEYIHWLGLIHGDAKACNCLITALKRVVLTDFGLGKIHETGDVTLGGIGQMTRAWAAPEIWNGSHHTFASDIWAVGVTFWEILMSGQSPTYFFDSMGLSTSLAKRNDEEPLYPLPESTPEPVQSLLLDCWRTDPQRRCTAADIARRLQLILDEPCFRRDRNLDLCLCLSQENTCVTAIAEPKHYPLAYARNVYIGNEHAEWVIKILGLPVHGGVMVGVARPPKEPSPSDAAAAAGAAEMTPTKPRAAVRPGDDAESWMLTWNGGLYHKHAAEAAHPVADSASPLVAYEKYRDVLCGTTYGLTEGCKVHFVLDLERRTLSASIGGRPMRVLFRDVTGPVSPVVCLYHAGGAVTIGSVRPSVS